MIRKRKEELHTRLFDVLFYLSSGRRGQDETWSCLCLECIFSLSYAAIKKESVVSCRLVLTGLYKPSVAKVSRQQSLQYFGLSCQTGAAPVTVKVKLKCFRIGRLGSTSLFARQSVGLKGRLNCLKISGWSLDFWTLSLYLLCAGIFIWIRLTHSQQESSYL